MPEVMPFGYPHMRTLAICVPYSGRPLPPELPIAFKNCSPPMNMNTVMFETKGKPIDEAREWFADQAIAHGAKYLFFWDEDVLLPAHALRELMFVADNYPKVAIVGGIYCLKTGRPEPLVFKGTGTGPYWDWKVGEIFECSAIGMGCTLIRTEVFKDIQKPWFKSVDDLSPHMDNIPSGEMWTEDLYMCLAPGQHVYGDCLPIENYNTDGKVVSHTGFLRDVLDTNLRQYEGPLFTIYPKYGASFQLTPNHPVEVERSIGNREFVPAGKLKKGDRLIVPIPAWRVREDRPDTMPMWPFIRGKYVEFSDNKFRYTRTHSDNSWFPLAPKVTADLCALCGYWVAEGSCCGDSGFVTFTFHQREQEYADDVQNLLSLCFGLDSSQEVNSQKQTRIVTCISTALHDFFLHYFGRLSPERQIPEEILMGSPSQITAFLRAYWRGDGCKTREEGELTTTSLRLAHAVRFLLLRLKIYAGLRKYINDSHISYRVTPAREFVPAWNDIRKLGRGLKGPRRRNKSPWLDLRDAEGYFSVAINNIESRPYSGPVHNLKIAVDETFNVHGFSVHNCRKVTDTKKWKIMAHGQLIMPHVDVRTGKHYTLPMESKPAQHLQIPTGTKKILDIGPGDAGPMKTNEGKVVSVDIRECEGVDYRCDFRKLPFATDEFDVVFSSHSLEHVRRSETSTTLDEWIRVLKKEGELRLIVPNLEWAAKKIVAGELDTPKGAVSAMDVLYAQQQYDEDFHKSGFTPKSLEALLRTKGFKHFHVETPNFHIVMRAWRQKPKGPIGKTVISNGVGR